jgi:methyl-accepting chemotaxis protein
MKQPFDGISQNVEYFAKEPRITTVKGWKNCSGADAAQIPDPENNQRLQEIFDRCAVSHQTIAYISVGQNDGGFAGWPEAPKMANYDPRARPWYKTAMAAAPGSTVRTVAYYWAPDDGVLVGTIRTFLVILWP